jgi:hypothetical protein
MIYVEELSISSFPDLGLEKACRKAIEHMGARTMVFQQYKNPLLSASPIGYELMNRSTIHKHTDLDS